MAGRLNWRVIIPGGVFIFAFWLLQSALSTLYAAIEPTCGGGSYGEKIAAAYQLLSLSTAITAAAVAWASYRFNTSLYRGGDRDG